jgi:hypothetical protein
MLRALLAVLLLANALYFGWARGWFAPTWPAPGAGEREPARLAAQVAPERVSVLSPAAASAALLAARPKPECLPPAAADGSQAAASSPMASASQADGLSPCEPGP